jgi:prolyl-tRNA editing enzyme YbaK/EbsC (Cys-tRNA(Pro) deacylase)
MNQLSPSAQRVQNALDAFGVELQVVEMPNSTRTSAEAAAAVGCTVGQIAKSLIFRGKESARPLLVIASGSNRVDEKKIAAIFGEKIEKPDADYVRTRTGFVIGGVPPVGHAEQLAILIDADLLQYEEIWAAAGTPNAVFRLTPQQLVEITRGEVVDTRNL